jgi:hypothetical protein
MKGNTMTTTTEAGTTLTVFGTDVTGTILAIVGDHAADFDLEAAANGYRDYLAGFLPDGYTISGYQVVKDVDAPHLDRAALREAVADDTDGFDISKYAKPDPTTPVTDDPTGVKSTALKCAKLSNFAALSLIREARHLAAQGTPGGYLDARDTARQASEAMHASALMYTIGGLPTGHTAAAQMSEAFQDEASEYDDMEKSATNLERLRTSFEFIGGERI